MQPEPYDVADVIRERIKGTQAHRAAEAALRERWLEFGNWPIPDRIELVQKVKAWEFAGFPVDLLPELVPLAMRPGSDDPWTFFCLCVWEWINDGAWEWVMTDE